MLRGLVLQVVVKVLILADCPGTRRHISIPAPGLTVGYPGTRVSVAYPTVEIGSKCSALKLVKFVCNPLINSNGVLFHSKGFAYRNAQVHMNGL